jgi:hypothetical protein
VSATTSNKGPTGATGVSVTISVPASFGVEAPPGACTFTGKQIVCSYANLSVGQQVVSNVVMVPSRTGAFTLSAKAAANQSDPAPGNNVSTVTVTVP